MTIKNCCPKKKGTISWIVGKGGKYAKFPGNGSAYYSSVDLRGKTDDDLLIFRNGLLQFPDNPGDGDSYYTKIKNEGKINFFPNLVTQDKITIVLL